MDNNDNHIVTMYMPVREIASRTKRAARLYKYIFFLLIAERSEINSPIRLFEENIKPSLENIKGDTMQ